MQRFENKTVVVTGGGGGIGGATSRRFGLEGARVAVFDLNLAAAEQVAAQIRAEGATARRWRCCATSRTAPASTPPWPRPKRRWGRSTCW